MDVAAAVVVVVVVVEAVIVINKRKIRLSFFFIKIEINPLKSIKIYDLFNEISKLK